MLHLVQLFLLLLLLCLRCIRHLERQLHSAALRQVTETFLALLAALPVGIFSR
jgi:hypothetical protein